MGKQTITLTQTKTPQDEIHLKDLEVQAIVGILPEERTQVQPLIAYIAMLLDMESAALSGDLSASVDYSRLAHAVSVILVEGRFRLLESAAVALARFVLATAPMVTSVSVRLVKPKALNGAGVPQVVVTRFRADVESVKVEAGGHVLFECPGTSLRLTPNPKSPGQKARETITDDGGRRWRDVDVMANLRLSIAAYEI